MSLKIIKNNEELIAKIAYMTGNKGYSTINVNFYKDNDIIEQKIYSFYSKNNNSAHKQAYLHLKTLPEFSDATDC